MDNLDGYIARSLRGHDKGSFYVIIRSEYCEKEKNWYYYIADGRGRKVGLPKRKNSKHISMTKEKISEPETLTDKKIREILHKYNFGGGSENVKRRYD